MFWKRNHRSIPEHATVKVSEPSKPTNNIPDFDKILANDINAILNNDICLSYLFISLISDFSPEVLLFYLEVNNFLENLSKPQEARKSYAQKIINTFIKSSSPLEINISSSIKQNILNNMFSEDISSNIFQKSHAQVFKQLESNLINFIQKPIYLQMINHVILLNKSFENREQIFRVIAAQITLALKKSYGVYVLGSETFYSDPGYLRSKSNSLTSSDLRTSLEAWAQIFANKYLHTTLPTCNDSCAIIGSMNPEHRKSNKNPGRVLYNTDSETASTLKTYINSNSAPVISNGLRRYAHEDVSNNESVFDTMSTQVPSMVSQKKSQFFGSKWLFKSKKGP